MEIRTRLKRGYIFRQGAIALVCVVLGLWGVYDYVWTIPNQQEAHDRLEVCKAVVGLHETDPADETFEEKKQSALDKVVVELKKLDAKATEELDSVEDTSTTGQEAREQQLAQLKSKIEQLNAQGDLGWLNALIMFRDSVQAPRTPTNSEETLTGIHAQAWELATHGVNEFADVSKPEAYDRIMKGLIFIPCLPIGLYMFLALGLQTRKHYRLDSEGNLYLPGGSSWNRDEIQDINMNKWMSKSIARVQHADGREIKLDDYIHQDMHLVVGGLAHRFHPDQWHDDGRKVKTESDEDDSDDESMGDVAEAVNAEAEADEHSPA